jgi:hypothetical protein
VSTTCPYCRAEITPAEAQLCPGCSTPHHQDCWEENQGCTVFGCPHAPSDEPKTTITTDMTGPNPGGNQTLPQSENVPPIISPPIVQAHPTTPQAFTTSPPTTGRPPSYLVLSIAFTLICCPAFPLGIVAIYHALQVEPRFTAGNIEGAKTASKQSFMWAWINFLSGLVLWLVIYVIKN